MYGVPVFVAAALCKFSAMSAHTTFMIINFGAVVIGYNVVQIESSKPFPTVSMLAPDFRYEVCCVVESYIALQQILNANSNRIL